MFRWPDETVISVEVSAIEPVERPLKKMAGHGWLPKTLVTQHPDVLGIGTQVAKGGESGYEDPPSFQATSTVSFLGDVVNFKVRSLPGSFHDFQ